MAELPGIYVPAEAASVVAPDGRKLVFCYVPQLALPIKRVLGGRPREFTYRWAYHPGHRIHVLLVYWPLQDGTEEEVGIALPEGEADRILDALEGEADIYLTAEPVRERLQGTVTHEEIARILAGTTISLPGVRFRRKKPQI